MNLRLASAVFAVAMAGSTLMVSHQVAEARVILKERVTYYNVKGKTGKEIFQSMLKVGPKVGQRDEQHALATTEFDYDIQNIDVAIRNGRCIPTDLDVVVNVKYTYPRWSGNRSASSATRRAWSTFNDSVIWHEKQHVKIAMEYAQDYENVLKKTRLKVSDNCEKASFVTKWRATRAALKHNRKQKQFDRRDLRPGGRGYQAQLNLIRDQ